MNSFNRYMIMNKVNTKLIVLFIVFFLIVLTFLIPIKSFCSVSKGEDIKQPKDQEKEALTSFWGSLMVVWHLLAGIGFLMFGASLVKNGAIAIFSENPQAAEEAKEGVKKAVKGVSLIILSTLIFYTVASAMGINLGSWFSNPTSIMG
jgi:Ca2+/Na+ antiporter